MRDDGDVRDDVAPLPEGRDPALPAGSGQDAAVPPWGTPGRPTPAPADPPEEAAPGWGTPAAGGPPRPPHGEGVPTWGTPPVAGLPQPRRGGGGRRSGLGRAGAGVAGGAAIAGKVGLVTKALLLLKGLAVLGKVKVLGSMLISVAVYALFWGWKFALGFVLLLAVHEFGHVVALRAQGVPASAPMFVPMMGAFVTVKGRQRSVAEEAWSAMAGPAAGALGCLAVLQLADLNGSLLLRALAYTGFLVNLFNLLPMLPLDGGRIAGALHPAVWLGGLGLAAVMLLWRPSPVLGFVLVLGGFEAVRRWRQHRAGGAGDYYAIPPQARGWIAAGYVGLAAACLYGMHLAYVARPA